MTLMLNSASSRDGHTKAGLYSTSDAFPRNWRQAVWLGIGQRALQAAVLAL